MKTLWIRFSALAFLAALLTLTSGCSWDYVSPEGVLHEDPSPVFSWSSANGFDIDLKGERQYSLPWY